jgi:hypothetical protein
VGTTKEESKEQEQYEILMDNMVDFVMIDKIKEIKIKERQSKIQEEIDPN